MLDVLDRQHGLEILSHPTAATRARAFLNKDPLEGGSEDHS
jgi:hypothetical protein